MNEFLGMLLEIENTKGGVSDASSFGRALQLLHFLMQ